LADLEIGPRHDLGMTMRGGRYDTGRRAGPTNGRDDRPMGGDRIAALPIRHRPEGALRSAGDLHGRTAKAAAPVQAPEGRNRLPGARPWRMVEKARPLATSCRPELGFASTARWLRSSPREVTNSLSLQPADPRIGRLEAPEQSRS